MASREAGRHGLRTSGGPSAECPPCVSNPANLKLRRCSNDPSAAHALTFTCFNQPFLKSDRACHWLADAIAAARHRHRFHLWAHVLMPTHVHLVLWSPTGSFDTSAILTSIKLPVTRRAAAYVKRHAPHFTDRMRDVQPNGKSSLRFWQHGGGYDRDLSEPATIHHEIDYLHLNAVRAGLVERPEAWQWSSAATFCGFGPAPLTPDVDSIPDPPSAWRFWSTSG